MAGTGRQPYSSILILLSLLLLITFSHVAEAYGRASASARVRRSSECRPRCVKRCKDTSHKKPCMFFCVKCCTKCLCVPPGTYGNKETCSCYNNWKTQEGRPKCP
ncbi:Gibberellin regulated protein [Quillaja saponaria]|uniref:Gibberellin regulated protein n=1 Tax=Quillaja saponaria TaxID=32244 RepID=A0AAD7LUW3_QUISA|nr:Gibberellin regulated protein [Quillaja saponaria]